MSQFFGVRINGIPQGLGSLVSGTASQITSTTNADGSITLSIPSAFVAPGSIAATTGVSGTTGTFTTSLISPAWIPAGGTAAVTGTLTASVAISVGSATLTNASGSTLTINAGLIANNNLSLNGNFTFAANAKTRLSLGNGGDGDVFFTNSAFTTGYSIIGTTNGTAWFKAVDGTSDTATVKANTLQTTGLLTIAQRGTASFTNGGATTVTVTLPVTEPDASYYVMLGNGANRTVYAGNKTTTTFDISISSTATMLVDWMIVR